MTLLQETKAEKAKIRMGIIYALDGCIRDRDTNVAIHVPDKTVDYFMEVIDRLARQKTLREEELVKLELLEKRCYFMEDGLKRIRKVTSSQKNCISHIRMLCNQALGLIPKW